MLRMRRLLKKPNLPLSARILNPLSSTRFKPIPFRNQNPMPVLDLKTTPRRFFSAIVSSENKLTVLKPKALNWYDYFIAGASDIGGTLWLRYCWQPEKALIMMLEHYGVTDLDDDIVSGPMGLSKPLHVKYLRDHPVVILKLIAAAEQKILEAQKDRKLTEEEIAELKKLPTSEEMFKYYETIQNQLILENAEIIPYSKDAVIALQKEKHPFFLTTGFESSTTTMLLETTKDQMPTIEPVISADEVSDRSRASMIIEGLKRTGILPNHFDTLNNHSKKEILNTLTKKVYFITDSVQDVKTVREALPNITIVAVTDFGTTMRIKHPSEMHQITLKCFLDKREKAQKKLLDAGADAVINDLRNLIPTLNSIAEKHLKNEKPVYLKKSLSL